MIKTAIMYICIGIRLFSSCWDQARIPIFAWSRQEAVLKWNFNIPTAKRSVLSSIPEHTHRGRTFPASPSAGEVLINAAMCPLTYLKHPVH